MPLNKEKPIISDKKDEKIKSIQNISKLEKKEKSEIDKSIKVKKN